MGGYAVTMTLHRSDARISRPHHTPVDAGATGRVLQVELAATAVERLELTGRPVGQDLRDWLASIGEAWSQMTFYLFDPDSWR